MSRKNRSPEENARRAKIRELLQMANIDSMDDIQDLFKETIAEWILRKSGQVGGRTGAASMRSCPSISLSVCRINTCCIVFPQMGVSRMGYGYCNIIYGQIRQKSLIFFVYL